MNQHDIDDRDADLEALLRTTFSAEAHQRVPEARAVPPFPAADGLATVHPLRRKWTGVVLVAAALVGIVVGGSLIGREAMDARPTPSAPAGTSVAPPPTLSTPAPSSTPTTAASTGSTPPAATKDLTVDGVTVTVPTSWGVQPLQVLPDYGMSRTCIAANPTDAPIEYAARRCALVVLVTDDYPNNPIDSTTYDVGLAQSCGEADAALTPLTDDTVTIGGRSAEHRTWSTTCLPSYSVETWTVVSWPQVQFVRLGEAADTATIAAVDSAVAGATLPAPVSSMRASDLGIATAMSGDVVSIDRITLLGSTVVNDNPATYDYPVAAGANIVAATTSIPNMAAMTLDQLRTEIAGGSVPGFLPIDQLYVSVQTDGRQATFVALRPRSQFG